ncbi:MAG: hypothetical protein CM15mP130_1140 [Verrucomicrobiota bacterium]|nr:MAG: hypothetical protein CM15mP130_1140 [Verrucomicrobiota bacterium]
MNQKKGNKIFTNKYGYSLFSQKKFKKFSESRYDLWFNYEKKINITNLKYTKKHVGKKEVKILYHPQK